MSKGDYYEGFEEGIVIGRREALEAAVKAASRPAGNRIMDFDARQAIIIRRIRDIRLPDHQSSEHAPTESAVELDVHADAPTEIYTVRAEGE